MCLKYILCHLQVYHSLIPSFNIYQITYNFHLPLIPL